MSSSLVRLDERRWVIARGGGRTDLSVTADHTTKHLFDCSDSDEDVTELASVSSVVSLGTVKCCDQSPVSVELFVLAYQVLCRT